MKGHSRKKRRGFWTKSKSYIDMEKNSLKGQGLTGRTGLQSFFRIIFGPIDFRLGLASFGPVDMTSGWLKPKNKKPKFKNLNLCNCMTSELKFLDKKQKLRRHGKK